MYIKIEDINAALARDAEGYIRACDAAYQKQVEKIAAFVKQTADTRPVILLSGPSGSGKTTTARMLERMLDESGFETHTLSMDNYFLPIAKGEKVDLESPDRVDGVLLNAQLRAIAAGDPVELPRFDFTQNIRCPSGVVLQRRSGELVILEGIHALNPNVITLPEEGTTRLYVSVRTRMVSGDMVLHPKKIRLLRRMERDKLFRGRCAADTLKMFESVQRGENRFIMPYKGRAMFDVDTFVPYGVGAYRDALLPELEKLRGREIDDLIRVLSLVRSVPAEKIPDDSLIREFIGGGSFGG